ncbi:hypothetical protein STXM2123_3175 [Streptomyces sp. F-3]|nr:hypothetical protein STXM2123_3175 [Streptomyces sp. F-3]
MPFIALSTLSPFCPCPFPVARQRGPRYGQDDRQLLSCFPTASVLPAPGTYVAALAALPAARGDAIPWLLFSHMILVAALEVPWYRRTS